MFDQNFPSHEQSNRPICRLRLEGRDFGYHSTGIAFWESVFLWAGLKRWLSASALGFEVIAGSVLIFIGPFAFGIGLIKFARSSEATTAPQTSDSDVSKSETPWVTPLTEYFRRDKHAVGPMVLLTVQCDDGSRKVVEGYHTGNEWWLSGMCHDDYYSTPLDECVGTPIAYRELPDPYAGAVVQAFPSADILPFPKSQR